MKSKASFERRMNQDLEDRKIGPGQYRSAKNVRVGTSQASNVGAVESEASNAIFTSDYTWPSGTNKCIGTCADIKNNAIVYCFYNSNNNHRIIHWDADTGTLTNILPTAWTVSVLGWAAGTKLWNMRIVETGSDQIMWFTDGTNPPRRINLNIRNQRAGTYTLTEDDISTARKPPAFAPTLAYAVYSTNPSSSIQNKFFQFQYRFIYENGEISSFSPLSELSIPPQDGVAYNKIVITFDSGVKGVAKVQIARREGNGSTSTGTVNPDLYIFNTWVKGSNSDSTNYTVDFYNNEVITAVALVDSTKLFDQVPQLAGCQEVVESNQVIYGDITEGYDNITNANVALNLTYDKTGIGEFTVGISGGHQEILVTDWELPPVGAYIYTQLPERTLTYPVSASDPASIGALLVALLNNSGYTASYTTGIVTTDIPEGVFFKCYWLPTTYDESIKVATLEKTGANQNVTGGYTRIDWDKLSIGGINKLDLTHFQVFNDAAGNSMRLVASIYLSGAGTTSFNIVLLDDTTVSPLPIYYDVFSSISFSGISEFIFDVMFDGTSLVGKKLSLAVEKVSGANVDIVKDTVIDFTKTIRGDLIAEGFKSGSTNKFGIVYYDDYLRQSGVQAKTSLYVPFPTQRTYGSYYNSGLHQTEGYIPQIDWEIKHLPPSWAKYYSWVYDGGSVQNYAQIVGVIKDITTDVGSGYIKISPNNFSEYKFIYTGFSVGDRVRILLNNGTNGVDNIVYESTLNNVFTTYIEGTISGFSSTEITVLTTNSQINVGNINGCLIEIFSITTSILYYEQTMYEIGNPGASNRYHKGPTQNQDPSNPTTVPAKGDFSGNCYFRLVANFIDPDFLKMITFLTESNSITYDAESNYWDKGRPQIETPDQRQRRFPSMYRWGNKLFQDTQVNNMSSFDSGNYGILSARFGTLTGMRQIGYTLKLIQESNYATAFVQRTQIFNADGTYQLVVTDSLIGTINESEYLYGTKHAGSIVVDGVRLYFLDTLKGKVIREAGNAPFPISDYGMVKYWRDACTQIEQESWTILSAYDKQTESLFITRRLTASQRTISFFDPYREGEEPGWVSEHDFYKTVNPGAVLNPIDMYGSVGQVFTTALNNGLYRHNQSTFLNLYGEDKTASIKSIFVLNPDQITAFLAHSVQSNRVINYAYFTIPVSAQNPYGMSSFLKAGNYALKEQVYYSEIKRDGLTQGFVSPSDDQYIIQMLEGRVMRGHVCLCEIEFSGSTIFVLYSHMAEDQYSPLS